MSYDYGFFAVTDAEIDRYEEAYPGVVLAIEFVKMTIWLTNNPSRRPKSERGYRRFVSGWLARTHLTLMAAQVRGEAAASYKERMVRKEVRVGSVR